MLFNVPIGTEEERNSGKIWPGQWFDATPYLTHYLPGSNWAYHTGADLNNNSPKWDGDAHSAVYAMGGGKVIYAQLYSKKVWGNLIIIDHGRVDGKPLFSRYAHVESITVSAGQLVNTGDQIARVGNGGGLFPFHLHFDISTTEQLRSAPYYWPGNDKKSTQHHFVDPRAWLRQQHSIDADASTDKGLLKNDTADTTHDIKPITWYVIDTKGAVVCRKPGIAAEHVGILPLGTKLSLEAAGGNLEGFTWGQISGGEFNGCWLAVKKEDQSETYISTNPPHK